MSILYTKALFDTNLHICYDIYKRRGGTVCLMISRICLPAFQKMPEFVFGAQQMQDVP